MAVIEIAGESRVRPTASGRTCFAIMLEEDNHSARVIAYHTDDLLVAEAKDPRHWVSCIDILDGVWDSAASTFHTCLVYERIVRIALPTSTQV